MGKKNSILSVGQPDEGELAEPWWHTTCRPANRSRRAGGTSRTGHRRQRLFNLVPNFASRTVGFPKTLICKTNQFGDRQADGGPFGIRARDRSRTMVGGPGSPGPFAV
ncbi:hypothetical protein AJ87_47770 [Rhizobium yanglingense]|nr:hypothetical protein AJ87_47770 [Rhizobium yanglingense]